LPLGVARNAGKKERWWLAKESWEKTPVCIAREGAGVVPQGWDA